MGIIFSFGNKKTGTEKIQRRRQVVHVSDKPYFWLRLDAFKGFNLAFSSLTVRVMWVARLQLPYFHLVAGSGAAEQYQPV
jgi:hypothetical protein